MHEESIVSSLIYLSMDHVPLVSSRGCLRFGHFVAVAVILLLLMMITVLQWLQDRKNWAAAGVLPYVRLGAGGDDVRILLGRQGPAKRVCKHVMNLDKGAHVDM